MANLPPREPPDLRNRGGYPPPGQQPPNQQPPPGTGPLPPYPPQGLPPVQPPQLGNMQPPSYPPTADPYYPQPDPNLQLRRSSRSVPGFPEITETRIEYLAWGSVVLLMGCSIIGVAVDTEASMPFLRVLIPLVAGTILLLSALLQRFISPTFKVTRATWGLSILGLAFGATQLIAILADSSIMSQMIYFIGFLVIISGVIMIIQVLRPPEYGA